MGRRTGVEGLEHKAKTLTRLGGTVAEDLENLQLDVRAVVAQAAGAELNTVEHQVVVRGTHLPRVGR